MTDGMSATLEKQADVRRVVERIEAGLPFAEMQRLQRTIGLPMEAIAQSAGISQRTLARRRRTGVLAADESDRLFRVSRIVSLVIDLFEGDRESARRWLMTPHKALGDATAMELIRTDPGAREVENLVGRLEHGIIV